MRSKQQERLLRLFRDHGVLGEVRMVRGDSDEAIFLVSTSGGANMRERDLEIALTNVLRKKVWVVTESPAWDVASDSLGAN